MLLTCPILLQWFKKVRFLHPHFCITNLVLVDYLERAQTLLAENDAVRAMIPAQFRTVLSTAVDRLDLAIRPGLITVRWTSLGVEDYFKNVSKALSSLRQLVKKVIHSHNPVPMVSNLSLLYKDRFQLSFSLWSTTLKIRWSTYTVDHWRFC